ncbi:MAG: NAD(P)H-dependent glycerol-3-phosphate dehydrogenase [Candidatus Marinimicrobia bacterium]|nr:NAD(P)H-dependent glycerol-3-phosphate dehydrogenase [Candidatus Neomarinimicrobiota bacterium]
MKISVLGAGSWGTTLAIHLSKSGHNVSLWERDREREESLKRDRESKLFLPGISFPDELNITDNIESSISEAETIVFAVPSQFMRQTAGLIKNNWNKENMSILPLVTVAKGFEVDTHLLMSHVLIEELDDNAADNLCVLSGPSHAEEVSRGVPTALVAASSSVSVSEQVQKTFFSPSLRVYVSSDVIGTELGGALKNIIAIAAGIVDGAGFGDNTKAALMTRGLVEITRLGVTMGAMDDTFRGLAGMGDMIVTCMSKHSRNRHVGEEVGKGRPLEQVLDEMTMTAEGVNTTKVIKYLSKEKGVEMPISDQVYEVLFEGKNPHKAVEDLMARDPKSEKMND